MSAPRTQPIPETVTPAGLRVRAEIMRGILDESCARHLELAAARIQELEGALKRYQNGSHEWRRRAEAAEATLAALQPKAGS